MASVETLLGAAYPWTLSLHVISVIAWMAGLFYLPRLYVYHVEKAYKNRQIGLVYEEMERKLLRVIMNPAMIGTWIFGLLLVMTPGVVDWSAGWPWVKAVAVVTMTGFHHLLGLWRKDLAADRNERSGRFFRMINEVPTLLMVVIVMMVIARPF